MSYIITKLQPLKSYPTYQFYARADSRNQDPDSVFRICILETFKWLRARLNDFKDKPPQIMTPEPENFAEFSASELTSFSYSGGLSVDVVYIAKKGVWSFRLTEPDMGANLGSENQRLPVNGRTFITEIAFVLEQDHVEAGVRTICSEPSDTQADCEVFRPRVVKALAENPDIRLKESGFIIDGKPLEIRSRAEMERFSGMLDDSGMNLPIVLAADSPTEEKLPEISAPDLSQFSLSGGLGVKPEMNVTVDAGAFSMNKMFSQPSEKPKKPRTKPSAPKPVKTKLPMFDYGRLADSAVGFAVVVFAEERFFRQIAAKLQTELFPGDILVISRGQITERLAYKKYSADMKETFRTIRREIMAMPKRRQYSFGEVLFHSDAKLKDYHTKRHEATSLEDQCAIYRQELDELRARVKELSQQHTDMQQTAEALRLANKRSDALRDELDELRESYRSLLEETDRKESAYRKNGELIDFYRRQIDIAADFPTNRDEVCSWIDRTFPGDIVLTQRARSEMRKYSGALDVAGLCGGIVFLSAYARFRRHEITEEQLELYAQLNSWEVSLCGKETIKMRRADYTVTYKDQSRILDQHIKRGVRSEELIRVYFFWDEDENRLVIGSMPGHLPTVKQST